MHRARRRYPLAFGTLIRPCWKHCLSIVPFEQPTLVGIPRKRLTATAQLRLVTIKRSCYSTFGVFDGSRPKHEAVTLFTSRSASKIGASPVVSRNHAHAWALGNDIRATTENRVSGWERNTELGLVPPCTFCLGWLGNKRNLDEYMRSGLRMNDDNVRRRSQTPQHVLLCHLFRNHRLYARIHQIELLIVREHLKLVCIFHAAQLF